MKYLIYDTTTGEILAQMERAVEDIHVDLEVGSGRDIFIGEADDVTQYIDVVNDAIIQRPDYTPVLDTESTPADGVSVVSLSGVPPGINVFVAGVPGFVSDGSALEFTFVEPGNYTVLLEGFPYPRKTVSINAY